VPDRNKSIVSHCTDHPERQYATTAPFNGLTFSAAPVHIISTARTRNPAAAGLMQCLVRHVQAYDNPRSLSITRTGYDSRWNQLDFFVGSSTRRDCAMISVVPKSMYRKQMLLPHLELSILLGTERRRRTLEDRQCNTSLAVLLTGGTETLTMVIPRSFHAISKGSCRFHQALCVTYIMTIRAASRDASTCNT
jgi:hypothetical protein